MSHAAALYIPKTLIVIMSYSFEILVRHLLGLPDLFRRPCDITHIANQGQWN